MPEEIERLLGRGASVQREADGYTVMSDPEGNQFCVVEVRPSTANEEP